MCCAAPAVTPQGGQSALQPPWPRQACTRAPRRLQPPHRRRDETELVAPQQPNWGRCPIRLGQTHFLPAPSLRGAVCAAGLASAGVRRRRRLAVCFFAVVSPYCWCCSGTNPPGRCCHCSFPPSTLSGPLSYPISFLTGRRPAAASARTRSSLPRHHYTHIHTLSYTASTHLLCSSPQPSINYTLHQQARPPYFFFLSCSQLNQLVPGKTNPPVYTISTPSATPSRPELPVSQVLHARGPRSLITPLIPPRHHPPLGPSPHTTHTIQDSQTDSTSGSPSIISRVTHNQRLSPPNICILVPLL